MLANLREKDSSEIIIVNYGLYCDVYVKQI